MFDSNIIEANCKDFSKCCNNSNLESNEDGDVKKIENIGKDIEFNRCEEVLENLQVKFGKDVSKISLRFLDELEKLQEERKVIDQNTQKVMQNICETKQNISVHKSQTMIKQETFNFEYKKMCEEMMCDIKSLQEAIDYQEDVVEFFRRLSSTEIVDIDTGVRYRIKIMNEEHIFCVQNDHDGQLCYEPVSYTKPPETLPEYLKNRIAFAKELCSSLFLGILQSMS